MVASEFTKGRGKKEIKRVLEKAKEKTGEQIKIYTTDGLLTYGSVIRKVVGHRELRSGKVKHNRVNASKGEGFNIKIERLHNSVRQRIKVNRGFHGSTESADALMKGWEIHYNFIRKHLSLGKTPSELATDIKLKENNKWLELIRLSQIVSNSNID